MLSETAPYTIYGIPCWVKSARARQTIRVVLQRIHDCAPDDFDRIKSRVTEFDSSWTGGQGLWIQLMPRRRRLGRAYFDGPVTVCLSKSIPRHAGYLVARMLAEVCIRETDLYESVPKHKYQKEAKEACIAGYISKWGALGKHGLKRRSGSSPRARQ